MRPAHPSLSAHAQATVFIVDDEPLMCRLIARILSAAGHRCETFDSAKKFLQTVDTTAGGCLLLDISMPDMTGPQLQDALVERGCRMPIIFLTAAADVATAVSVLKRGAVTLIEKPCAGEVLVRTVNDALEIDKARRAQLLELDDLKRRFNELTPREREVAELLANGKSNRQVAITLGLSERTVEIHRGRIRAKMGCDSIVGLGLSWHKLQDATNAASQRQSRGPAPT